LKVNEAGTEKFNIPADSDCSIENYYEGQSTDLYKAETITNDDKTKSCKISYTPSKIEEIIPGSNVFNVKITKGDLVDYSIGTFSHKPGQLTMLEKY
jgi:hypothetical protein